MPSYLYWRPYYSNYPEFWGYVSTEVEAIVTPKPQTWRDGVLLRVMQSYINDPMATVTLPNGVNIRPRTDLERAHIINQYQPPVAGDLPYSIVLTDQTTFQE